jgi:hypothetical protein
MSIEYFQKVRRRMLRTNNPRNAQLGPDRVIVHNHVTPAAHNGLRGFRAWTQDKDRSLVECPCCWAGYNHDGKVKHYRFRDCLPDKWRNLPAAELRKKLVAASKKNEKWRQANDTPTALLDMTFGRRL